MVVAGGYFGHCWEPYDFWMLTPLSITPEVLRMQAAVTLIPLLVNRPRAGTLVNAPAG
jgi:hypothetical protein